MHEPKTDYCKRDRFVLYTVLAHVPAAAAAGAMFGHLLAGISIAAAAALCCIIAFAGSSGTRAFRVYGAMLLMADSAALIAASGGQSVMHFHVFIVLTFLTMYFDWLPIVAGSVAIAAHHALGNVFFPQLVFGDMTVMGNSWLMVLAHTIAVAVEAAVAIFVAQRIRVGTAAIAAAGADIAGRQLPRFRAAIDALAGGDLTCTAQLEFRPLAIDPADEIGAVATSFNRMQAEVVASVAAFERTRENLCDMVGALIASAGELSLTSSACSAAMNAASLAVETISVASGSVASGSVEQAGQMLNAAAAIHELGQSAVKIASGAAEQKAAVQAVVAEVQALNTGIAAVGDRGRKVSAFVQLATTEASTGIEAVVETENAVILLREQLATNETLMSSLERRSDAVREIVAVIDGIAEQTNLLALNAAIEAARAGDQGRGFAVVADEVRKLAERSATSTREIGQILETIRRETIEAATSMRASSSFMDRGLALASRARGALETLGSKIEDTSRIATALLNGSQTMEAASTRATASIEGVSLIIEQNAAAAENVGSTTAHVGDSLGAVQATSDVQSRAAGDVSASLVGLGTQIGEVLKAADALQNQVQAIGGIVGHFRIDAAVNNSLVPARLGRHSDVRISH